MIPRAGIAMVIVHRCHQAGDELIPDDICAAAVLVAVMTSIAASLILRTLLVEEQTSS